MIGGIICIIIACLCMSQGAVEGAIALGILAVILFAFRNKTPSDGGKTAPPPPKKKPEPDPQYQATPSMINHYRNHPVVTQIVREIRKVGGEEYISISEGGTELFARGNDWGMGRGRRSFTYVFKDHGYQALSLSEQQALLMAIVEKLPHSDSYKLGYMHSEKSNKPLNYFVKTDYYRDNQYRWNPDAGTWEKMVKL